MGAPNPKFHKFMQAQGYELASDMGKRLKMHASTAINTAGRLTGNDLIRSGKYYFVRPAAFEAQVKKDQAKRAKSPARINLPAATRGATVPTGTGRPPKDQGYWAKMRAVVREELRAVLADYEVVTESKGAASNGTGHYDRVSPQRDDAHGGKE